MGKHELDVLYSAQQINERVKKMGEEISSWIAQDKDESEVFVIIVLKGAFMFAADLVRAINTDRKVSLHFIQVSSYGSSTTSSRKPTLLTEFKHNIEDKRTIIVEDIIDTGHTAKFLIEYFNGFKPRDLLFTALLDKSSRREVPISSKNLYGFEIEDKFVVGYGLDFDQQYRNLPFIGVVKTPSSNT